MTDKERLEALLNNPAIQHKEILWAINYAKEQAERAESLQERLNAKLAFVADGKEEERWALQERVQELENARKTLSDNHFQQIEQHKNLLRQNKRYREAYKNAKYEYISLAPYGAEAQRDGMLEEINKALEESE